MNTIEAETAYKLAGLQVDLLQKLRQGHMTVSHLEWFLNLSQNELGKLSGIYVPKFRLLADLGVLVVPDDYDHATHLGQFGSRCKEFYNDNITDRNFSNPSRILKPSDRIRVRLHEQIKGGITTSDERVAYLKTQSNAVLLGAQGITLVYDQMRNQLLKGKGYCSFDEKGRLPLLGNYRGVPYLNADIGLDLCAFENDWNRDYVLVSFSDET